MRGVWLRIGLLCVAALSPHGASAQEVAPFVAVLNGEATAPAPPAETVALPEAEPVVAPKVTARLRGRIQIDAVGAAQSVTSKAILGDLQNGYGFRRARLGAEGEIGREADYVAEVDFADGNVRFADFFIGITAVPYVSRVQVGYFREPYSLEGATSSRFITFLERSTLNVLDPARNWGVAAYWWPEGERMTFATGAFRDGTSRVGVSVGDEDSWSFTSRLTGLPIYDSDEDDFRLMHLGGAFSQRAPSNGAVTYTPSPNSKLLELQDNAISPLLLPVSIPSESQQLYNAQFAYVKGPFSVQAEWSGTTIQQPAAGVVFFHGFYTYVSYFLTGEHRGYDTQAGKFNNISVLRPVIKDGSGKVRGTGAVELAARFTYSDFTSSNLPANPPGATSSAVPTFPDGLSLYEATLGVNWYLSDHLRLMGNYTLAIPDAGSFSRVPVHVFGARLALFF